VWKMHTECFGVWGRGHITLIAQVIKFDDFENHPVEKYVTVSKFYVFARALGARISVHKTNEQSIDFAVDF